MKLLTIIYGALAVNIVAAVAPALAAPVNNDALAAAETEDNHLIGGPDDGEMLGRGFCAKAVSRCITNGGFPHPERGAKECWVEICRKYPKTCGKKCKKG